MSAEVSVERAQQWAHDRNLAEARVTLEFFSTAADGAMVMDGRGVLLRAKGGVWWRSDRSGEGPIAPASLARQLCPDLAEEIDELADAARAGRAES